VGRLVGRHGFPLQVGCWEGNKAETTTIIPIAEAFQAAHGIEDLIIVADAGMLSAANLTALDEARLRFIVGARTTRAPGDLEAHFHWHGDAFTDGQVIDTITPRRGSQSERDKSRKSEPVWDPHTHPGSWRAVWVYSKKRAARDNQTLTAQANRARAVIAGEKRPKGTRFVTVHQGDQVLDEASIARARSLVGLKGYVTNIPSRLMGAGEVVSSYHELWHVEQSFRMSKHDLRARPVFHHTHDAIEAHLTVVMAALAVARYLQDTTGISIARIVRELRGLQEVTINLNGHHLAAAPRLTDTADDILTALSTPPPGTLSVMSQVRRAKSPRTTRSVSKDQCPADLVKRHLEAFAPGGLWVADIPPQAGGAPSYVRTFSGWVYVVFITDVLSRRIVGRQTTCRPVCTDRALDALEMALWQRKRAGADLTGLVHHLRPWGAVPAPSATDRPYQTATPSPP